MKWRGHKIVEEWWENKLNLIYRKFASKAWVSGIWREKCSVDYLSIKVKFNKICTKCGSLHPAKQLDSQMFTFISPELSLNLLNIFLFLYTTKFLLFIWKYLQYNTTWICPQRYYTMLIKVVVTTSLGRLWLIPCNKEPQCNINNTHFTAFLEGYWHLMNVHSSGD